VLLLAPSSVNLAPSSEYHEHNCKNISEKMHKNMTDTKEQRISMVADLANLGEPVRWFEKL
jgi:hypothetical protein